jgi:hypothetical protein
MPVETETSSPLDSDDTRDSAEEGKGDAMVVEHQIVAMPP